MGRSSQKRPRAVPALLAGLILAGAAHAAAAAARAAAPHSPPPEVSIAAPAPGARLEGTVAISARAASTGVAGLQFRLDGAALGTRISSRPFAAIWNTARTPDGPHLLTAELFDAKGNSTSSDGVSVVVDNGPVLASEITAGGLSGTGATISWRTNKPADGQVEYGPTPEYGASAVPEGAAAVSHSASLNGLTPGTAYHFRVKSKGGARAPAVSDDATFTTLAASTDTTPPSVVIMNPAAGASLSGTAAVSVNASDNTGVASVQFMADGGELGLPVTAPPFTFAWHTAGVPDGTHTLGAVARDAAGNSATAVVSIRVANAPPVISAPTLAGASSNRVDLLWKTDQRADSAVEYGPTPTYGAATPVNPAQSTGHGVTLSGLAPGTPYHYRVKSRNAAGVLAVSDDLTFTTLGTATVGTSSATAAASAPDPTSAKAPQKFLTPASADGINDQAVFGPGAREVTIFDLRGRKVFHGSSSGPAAPVVWNCKDGAGRVVPAGVYLAKIVARDSSAVYQSFAVAK
jgi:hypothetical protein